MECKASSDYPPPITAWIRSCFLAKGSIAGVHCPSFDHWKWGQAGHQEISQPCQVCGHSLRCKAEGVGADGEVYLSSDQNLELWKGTHGILLPTHGNLEKETRC